MLITSSAWRTDNGALCGGVGMLVKKYIEKTLADAEPFYERILITHFLGNPHITIIMHYEPTEGSPNAEEN